MTQEQTQISPLEGMLLNIAGFYNASEGIKDSKDAGVRTNSYYNLVDMLFTNHISANPNLTKQEKLEAHDEYLQNVFSAGPENAMRLCNEGMTNGAKAITEDYKANKDELVSKIVTKMDENIKKAETKAEAADIMASYLKHVVNLPELDQEGANRYRRQELALTAGVNTLFYGHGNPKKVQELQLRTIAGENLKSTKVKDGETEKTVYSVDKDKLMKLVKVVSKNYGMPEVIPVSLLYTNAMTMKLEEKKE